MSKVKLTKTSVEKLPVVTGKQVVTWDAEITGFGVRVSPGGSRTYFYQDRLNGRSIKISIGKHGKITADAARARARELQAKITLGEDPTPEKYDSQKAATLGELLTAYIQYLESQGKNSARAVQKSLERHVHKEFPRLWKKPADEITLHDCLEIVGAINDRGNARQADKVRAYLKSAYSVALNSRGSASVPKAMRDLKISTNPARELRKIEGSGNAKERALTVSEFRAYWRRVLSLPEPKRSLALLHILTGGQRQQQLARVTLSDIDPDAPSMTIWDNKGRRSQPRRHVIPLLPECVDAMTRIGGGGDYVFSCNGGQSPIHVSFLNDITKGICDQMEKAKELEKGRFTAGAIRATIETRLIAAPYRVSSDVLAHLLSHGMGGIQQKHYQRHDFFDEKLEALQKLQRMLDGKDEPSAAVIPLKARA